MEEELKKKIIYFISKLEKNNLTFSNIIFKDFLSVDIQKEYKELSKDIESVYKEEGYFILLKMISEKLKINPNEIKKYYLRDIAVNDKKNLVSEIYPTLIKTKDDLVEVNYSVDMNKDGFEYKKHYLIFEPELSSNFHLIEWIIKNWKSDSKFYVSIDMNKLGLPETIRDVRLLSHWEGPKTVKNVAESFKENELVIKCPANANTILYDKVEFLFKNIGGKWHLEIEELLPRRWISFDLDTSIKGN